MRHANATRALALALACCATLTACGSSAEDEVRAVARELRVNRTFATSTSTAAYKRCWRAAGAQIATSAQDLSFAAADLPVVAVRKDRVSAKGGNWRIFYTLPADRRDPSLEEVIADPRAAGVVAYIADASAHTGVVERARACAGGG